MSTEGKVAAALSQHSLPPTVEEEDDKDLKLALQLSEQMSARQREEDKEMEMILELSKHAARPSFSRREDEELQMALKLSQNHEEPSSEQRIKQTNFLREQSAKNLQLAIDLSQQEMFAFYATEEGLTRDDTL